MPKAFTVRLRLTEDQAALLAELVDAADLRAAELDEHIPNLRIPGSRARVDLNAIDDKLAVARWKARRARHAHR